MLQLERKSLWLSLQAVGAGCWVPGAAYMGHESPCVLGQVCCVWPRLQQVPSVLSLYS